MPQLQLPIFPAGVTEINRQIAVEKKAGMVYYIHGHLPVVHHHEEDVQGFGMFTVTIGTPNARTISFGLSVLLTIIWLVKRYVKVLRERGAEGFYIAKPRHSSASVLEGEVLERAQPDRQRSGDGQCRHAFVGMSGGSHGALGSAPIQFQSACDVTGGGVLLALPACLAVGLLTYTPQMCALPKGFYGIDSIFLLLALMALRLGAHLRSAERRRRTR